MVNIGCEEAIYLKDQIQYKKGGVNKKVLAENNGLKIALVAIDEGAALPKHSAPGDAIFFCLEGQGTIVRDDGDHPIHEGKQFIFKKDGEHSVQAKTPLKFCLVVEKKA